MLAKWQRSAAAVTSSC